MRPKILLPVFIFLAIVTVGHACLARSLAQARQKPPDAVGSVRRLPPSAFPNLPRAVRKRAEDLGCEIPQESFSGATNPGNVITGEFARRGQKDWAILCSKGGSSSIVVFWGKTSSCPSEMRAQDDACYLQGDGTGHFAYSRKIRTANEVQPRSRPGTAPADLINHQGIEDAFTEKGSTVVYCVNGSWKEIAGAE